METKGLNKKKFKKYFFNGIENKEELLEGIIYFSYFKDVFFKSIEMQRNTNNEKHLTGAEEKEMLAQRATEVYKQFYRFIELNNKPNIYNYKRVEDLEKIEQKVRNKIEQLLQTQELTERKDGLSYSKKQRFRFIHYPEGTSRYGDTNSEEYYKIEKHWTEDVYDILIYLEEAEKADNQGYIDLWLRTRLSRATTCEPQNRIQGIEQQEISRLKHACEKLRKIRVAENKKNHEELEIEF